MIVDINKRTLLNIGRKEGKQYILDKLEKWVLNDLKYTQFSYSHSNKIMRTKTLKSFLNKINSMREKK